MGRLLRTLTGALLRPIGGVLNRASAAICCFCCWCKDDCNECLELGFTITLGGTPGISPPCTPLLLKRGAINPAVAVGPCCWTGNCNSWGDPTSSIVVSIEKTAPPDSGCVAGWQMRAAVYDPSITDGGVPTLDYDSGWLPLEWTGDCPPADVDVLNAAFTDASITGPDDLIFTTAVLMDCPTDSCDCEDCPDVMVGTFSGFSTVDSTFLNGSDSTYEKQPDGTLGGDGDPADCVYIGDYVIWCRDGQWYSGDVDTGTSDADGNILELRFGGGSTGGCPPNFEVVVQEWNGVGFGAIDGVGALTFA